MNINQEVFNAALGCVSTPHGADCDRIISVGRNAMGIVMTPMQAQTIWQWWSDQMCASWLAADAYTQDEIVAAIESFVRARLESILT